MVDCWEFEDKMNNVNGLFSNGLRDNGISCHRESYMTVMDFNKWIEILRLCSTLFYCNLA